MVETEFKDLRKKEGFTAVSLDGNEPKTASSLTSVLSEIHPSNTFIPKERLLKSGIPVWTPGGTTTSTRIVPIPTATEISPIEQSEQETVRELLTDDTFTHNAYERSTNEHMAYHGEDEYLRREDIWKQVDDMEKKLEDRVDRTKQNISSQYHTIEQKWRETKDQTKEALIGVRDRLQQDIDSVKQNIPLGGKKVSTTQSTSSTSSHDTIDHGNKNRIKPTDIERVASSQEGLLKSRRTVPDTGPSVETTVHELNQYRSAEHLTKTLEEQLRPDAKGLVGVAKSPKVGSVSLIGSLEEDPTVGSSVITTSTGLSGGGGGGGGTLKTPQSTTVESTPATKWNARSQLPLSTQKRESAENIRHMTTTEYANVKLPVSQRVFEPKAEEAVVIGTTATTIPKDGPHGVEVIEEEVVLIRQDPLTRQRAQHRHIDELDDLMFTYGDLEPTVHMMRKKHK